MDEKDESRLRDMLDAARKGLSFAAGKARTALDTDHMLTFALIKAVEIVGEAASRVTPETRALYPQIPWKGIIGMRNKVIHDYMDMDLDILWETATLRLPELVMELEKILAPEDD